MFIFILSDRVLQVVPHPLEPLLLDVGVVVVVELAGQADLVDEGLL